jgi:hypothetical protein
MRKTSLLAILAISIFATVIALPHRADAMTFGAPSALRSAATKVAVAQPQQVSWCSWFGCRVGYYRPWPYYAFYHRSYWRWRLMGVVAS